MAISHDEVRRVAELARLSIDEAQLPRLAGELSAILDFVATLDRLDLQNCEPSVFAPAGVPLREDRIDGRRLGAETALRGAPEGEDGFFLVPPVVENVNP